MLFDMHPKRLFDKNKFINLTLVPSIKKHTQHSVTYLPSNSTFSKQFFKHYIKLNLFIPSEAYTVHSSYSRFYLLNSGKNLAFLNLKWFFKVWSLFISFLENLFYYNVLAISFSNPFLKEESLSLNWNYLELFKGKWRFSNLFYLFVNNSNTPNISKFLQALRLKNYHIAFVSDVIYHKRTVHSLNKNNFISVGPLPLTLSFYTLSFSIPVATNSLVSNTFFLRLVLKVKSQNSFSFFNRRKLHWNSIDGT